MMKFIKRKRQDNQLISQTYYKMKKIRFSEKDIPIILQNKNGPCLLIAICNFLLLKGIYELKADVTRVSEGQLLEFVTERLFNSLRKDENGTITEDDATDFMRSLPTGMDVDVKFTRIDDFELTKESRVFGLLGIRLVHGWLVDPQDVETKNAIGSKSYNTLMGELVIHLDTEAVSVKKSKEDNVEVEHLETIAESSSLMIENSDGVISEPTSNVESSGRMKEAIAESSSLITTNSDGVISEPTLNVVESSKKMKEASTSSVLKPDVELIKAFLDNNASQLTVYGLYRLEEDLTDQELCLFFRNNHFNTMLKHLDQLYILVTDEGYMDKPGVVWEKLTKVNGDTILMNSNFHNETKANYMKLFEDNLPRFKERTPSIVVKKKDANDVLETFNDHIDKQSEIEEREAILRASHAALDARKEERKRFKENFAKKFNPEKIGWTLSEKEKESLKKMGLDESDFDPEAGNPAPDPEAGNPAPDPEAGNPAPDPEAGNPTPDPDAGNPSPEPELERDIQTQGGSGSHPRR